MDTFAWPSWSAPIRADGAGVVDHGGHRLAEAVARVGRTDFITPDQIGWGPNNASGLTMYYRLRSFSVV